MLPIAAGLLAVFPLRAVLFPLVPQLDHFPLSLLCMFRYRSPWYQAQEYFPPVAAPMAHVAVSLPRARAVGIAQMCPPALSLPSISVSHTAVFACNPSLVASQSMVHLWSIPVGVH